MQVRAFERYIPLISNLYYFPIYSHTILDVIYTGKRSGISVNGIGKVRQFEGKSVIFFMSFLVF